MLNILWVTYFLTSITMPEDTKYRYASRMSNDVNAPWH